MQNVELCRTKQKTCDYVTSLQGNYHLTASIQEGSYAVTPMCVTPPEIRFSSTLTSRLKYDHFTT